MALLERHTAEEIKSLRIRRDDFVQKVSRKLVNEYGIICFEYLNINNMVKNNFLAKNTMDCTWGKLVKYTSYKVESAGMIVVLVDPRNTSKMYFMLR